MIIVLAGTSEGRTMAGQLQEAGFPVLVSVASKIGAELLRQQEALASVQGTLRREGLAALIRNSRARFLVDATHPFAVDISREAMEAAADTGTEYLRLERQGGNIPQDPLVTMIKELEELEDYLTPGMRIFSTLGSKSLPAILPMIRGKKAELTARVLPGSSILEKCEQLGLRPNQIVAMQGPFSRDLNSALFKHYGAQLVISKESGPAGGLETKIEAAVGLGIPILVWSRPRLDYPRVFHSNDSLLDYIKRAAWEKT